MGETRIVFLYHPTDLGRPINTRSGTKIFTSLRGCVNSLLSIEHREKALTVFTNPAPLIPGVDFHSPSQKEYSTSVMLRECRGWLPISLEEVTKIFEDVRVEIMEKHLSSGDPIPRKMNMGPKGWQPIRKWLRLSNSLDWYEPRLATLYPTQRDLDLDSMGRSYGGGNDGRAG